MKIKIYFLALAFLSITALEASSKKPKKVEPQVVVLPSNMVNGPSGGDTKSICPPCPNFTCPAVVIPTGATACTGPECFCTPETAANFCCIVVDTTVTVEGGSNIGNATIGDLTVGLNANFKDDLTVEEDAQFNQDVCIEGDKSVCGDVTIDGFAVVLGMLQVNTGGMSASGPLIVNGNDFINGNITVTGNQNVTGTLTVGGPATFNGTLVASGGLSVFNGQTINSGGLIILNPSGCTGCTGAIINGNVCVNGNTIANDVNVTGTLTVDELATFNNVTTSASGTLITNGPVIMNDGLTIASGDEIMEGGSKIVGGNLSVGGTATFQGPVFANQGATINEGLVVEGGSTVDSLDITSGNLSVSGVLFVSGPISGGATTLASLTITDTTNSQCPSGPAALVVLGGAGFGSSGVFGRDLWIGGAEYFANTASETGSVTSFDYYEETCYSTAFTWGGLTVNPPAHVMVKVLRVGNIVNLLIPSFIYNNPGIHIDVITSTTPMPERFRPFTTVRGAASTIITRFPTEDGPILIAGLGEYNVSPGGIITFGLPGNASGPLGSAADALGPQRIFGQDFVMKDIDTITYNINGCEPRCKIPCP